MVPKGLFYLLAFVADMQRSKKFYGETLGWKLGTEESGSTASRRPAPTD